MKNGPAWAGPSRDQVVIGESAATGGVLVQEALEVVGVEGRVPGALVAVGVGRDLLGVGEAGRRGVRVEEALEVVSVEDRVGRAAVAVGVADGRRGTQE